MTNPVSTDTTDLLHPEMRKALEQNNALQPAGVNRDSLPFPEIRKIFAETRKYWNTPALALHRVYNHSIQGKSRTIPVRFYHPNADPKPAVIVYCHGGGWVLGSSETHDPILREVARATGYLVIGVDYALAPENPFPAALDDVRDVLEYVFSPVMSDRVNQDAVFVGGDSSGANIALSAATSFEQMNKGTIKAGFSYYGVLDAELDSPSMRRFGSGAYGLSVERMSFYWDQYVPDASKRHDPQINLCAGGEAGRFPTYVVAAACDPLCDSSLKFAAANSGFNVNCQLDIRRGMGHAFMGYGRILGDEVTDVANRTASFLQDAVK